MTGKELDPFDRVTDRMRQSAIDLSTLTRPADDAQIDAMVYVTLLHQYRTEIVQGNTANRTVCDCGWFTDTSPSDFARYQWEVTRHIMADMVERVFRTPSIR